MENDHIQEGFMDRERIKEAIRAVSAAGRLTCEQAHGLSSDLGVPLSEIGAACNELKIKIAACQLGCF
jgi:hypothetical protein